MQCAHGTQQEHTGAVVEVLTPDLIDLHGEEGEVVGSIPVLGPEIACSNI